MSDGKIDVHKVWNGDLVLPDDTVLEGINFSLDSHVEYQPQNIPAGSLRFLAFVDPNRIPLHLAAGPNFKVTVDSLNALEWFFNAFQCRSLIGSEDGPTKDTENGEKQAPSIYDQCDIAVLARVPTSDESNVITNSRQASAPRLTEILLYAVGNGYKTRPRVDVLPGYDMYALPLSSDYLYTPSQHPGSDAKPLEIVERKTASESTDIPAAKKERLGDLFDAASDRKKRAKRKGGESISLAASRGSPAIQPQTFDGLFIKAEPGKEEPDLEASGPTVESLAAPVIAKRRVAPSTLKSTRPPSRANIIDQTKPGNTEAAAQHGGFEDASIETRNRQIISRTVMAGMRIYGLQQQKPDQRKSQKDTESQAQISAGDDERKVNVEAKDPDFEYKAVYHQTYKAAAFALRHRIGSELLQHDQIREAVDKLLALFCQSS